MITNGFRDDNREVLKDGESLTSMTDGRLIHLDRDGEIIRTTKARFMDRSGIASAPARSLSDILLGSSRDMENGQAAYEARLREAWKK